MTERAPVKTTNLDRYGSPPLEWRRARDRYVVALPTMEVTTFIGTVRPDGRPHAAAIGALWLRGDVYFTSSPAARKARTWRRTRRARCRPSWRGSTLSPRATPCA